MTIAGGPTQAQPGTASSLSQAVANTINQIAEQIRHTLGRLRALFAEMDTLLANEPRDPGPMAPPALRALYQMNHAKWRARVDAVQDKIDALRRELAELEHQLAELGNRMVGAQRRDAQVLTVQSAGAQAYLASLQREVSVLGKEIDAARKSGATGGGLRAAYARVLPTLGRVSVAARGVPLV